jgi:putative transposase
LRPTQRKQLVGHLIDRYRVSVKRACAVCKQSRAGWYDKPTTKVLDAPLKKRMHEIAATPVRFGFWRIFVLIRREGWRVNHKRIYRLYKEEGLNLRSKVSVISPPN